MSRRRTVCFVLPSLAGGGAERAAVQILNGLDAAAWDRRMYLFRREGPYLSEIAADIQVHAGASRSRLGRWWELQRFIRDTRPDLVVSFLSYLSVLSAVRFSLTGARVVFNQQTPISAFLEDADYGWRRPLRKRVFTALSRIGYAAADLVITTSRGVSRDLIAAFGVDPGHVRVVPNPIDVDAVRAASAEPVDADHASRFSGPVIVAAGRLADAKNYPLLLEALAIVRRRVAATLIVLGQGEREAELRKLADTLGVGDAVVWCGFQSNPWRYMARADVFALTSQYEGFGNVLVESMACGVPVVATRSPGTEDIIRDGVDGLLVSRHSADAVASALLQVLTDGGLRDRLAGAARGSADRFARRAIAVAYHAVLSEVVA